MKIEWNKVIYADCMNEENGLPSLPDKSIDLCITDPPYNIKNHLSGVEKKNSKKIQYKDNFKENEYYEWCRIWFSELKRICNIIIFTPGYTHFRWWLREDDFWYLFWYNPGRQGACIPAMINKVELIIVWNIESRSQFNRFSISTIRKTNDLSVPYIHPCPRNKKVWEWILKELEPTSVLDPFLGSGTTAEVCTKLGIPWIGYEIMKEYSVDINKRLKNCKKEPQQVSLEAFK